jgi:hypothetical protein
MRTCVPAASRRSTRTTHLAAVIQAFPPSGSTECVSSSRCQTTENDRGRINRAADIILRKRPARCARRNSMYRTGRRPRKHAASSDDPSSVLRLPHSDWWSQTGSNRRPHACKARALPTELWPRAGGAEIRKSEIRSQNANLLASDFWVLTSSRRRRLVGLGGLEPPTSRLSSARSNQLSYKPFSED